MNQSERKLKKILGLNKPWHLRFIDCYIDNPVFLDIVIGILVVSVNYLIIKNGFQFFSFEKEAVQDILNELISSSLSAGGFVLAALAIIAGIKQTVPDVTKSQKPVNGREYFFNSIGYENIIKMYSIACIVFLISFLYFSFVRGAASGISPVLFQILTTFGIVLVSLTFLRCVLILWAIIRIK